MRKHRPMSMLLVAMTLLILTGCNDNKRLAEQAQLHAQRQAEQSQQMVALQKELATVQRETQVGRNELGRQRDELEDERRQIAATRYTDPIVANAISNIGLLLICSLPLIVCWQLLRQPVDPADDNLVTELLLEDFVSETPLFLSVNETPAIGFAHETRPTTDEHQLNQQEENLCHTS